MARPISVCSQSLQKPAVAETSIVPLKLAWVIKMLVTSDAIQLTASPLCRRARLPRVQTRDQIHPLLAEIGDAQVAQCEGTWET